MKKNALYKIELENKSGQVFESFNNLEDYHSYLGDLVVEAYDSYEETDNIKLFNFITWFVVIDECGDFKSLTTDQFKTLD